MANTWRLALEQTSDLKIVAGSLTEVAEAVRRGADLRLYMVTETYEETLYFQQTYSGAGDAFAGIMSHHHSYVHRGTIPRQPYISFFRYDTSGAFSQVKWMLDNTVLDESQAYPYRVYRWYVCDRWRVVYEHDADGKRIQGDLDELKEQMRTGRTIKVGVRGLFGMTEAEEDSRERRPDEISFISCMQPLIEKEHVLSNCDFALIGAARWPFAWKDGLAVAMMQPSTSGEIVCFWAEPGKLPFRRIVPRRAMQWLVADEA